MGREVKMGWRMPGLCMDRHDGLGNCQKLNKGECDKLQFLVFKVPTF